MISTTLPLRQYPQNHIILILRGLTLDEVAQSSHSLEARAIGDTERVSTCFSVFRCDLLRFGRELRVHLSELPTTRQLNRSSQALPRSTSIKSGMIRFAPR